MTPPVRHAVLGAFMLQRRRSKAPEEGTVAIPRLAGGTLTVSDSTAAPWSWEPRARGKAERPPNGEDWVHTATTFCFVALPSLTRSSSGGRCDRCAPNNATRVHTGHDDPLVLQDGQVAAAVRREAAPLATGGDGLAALATVQLITRSAGGGRPVAMPSLTSS